MYCVFQWRTSQGHLSYVIPNNIPLRIHVLSENKAPEEFVKTTMEASVYSGDGHYRQHCVSHIPVQSRKVTQQMLVLGKSLNLVTSQFRKRDIRCL